MGKSGSAERSPVYFWGGEPVHPLQLAFFVRMGALQQFQQLFAYLPGVYFFVKDAQSRMVCASQPIVERLGCERESQLIGTTDYDHFPKHVADNFVRDDRWVMQNKQPLLNKIEFWYNEQRLLDWFVTNKLPVFAENGDVIGVMGTLQSHEGHLKAVLPYTQIERVVEHVREHHRSRLTVTELAEVAGISPRQLHRRFLEVFGMSVQDFLMKTRIHAACDELLHTDKQISEIAIDLGFCDQSAFTQQFRKHTGLTPLRFRRRHLS